MNMTVVVANNNLFYTTFRDQHPCWPLIGSALSLGLIAISGIALNSAVVWTTFRTKSLRGTANLLLALTAVLEVLHQQGHLVFLFTALSGVNFIERTLALQIGAPSLLGTGAIPLLMTATGVDRLLCILVPSFPKKVNHLLYLGAISLSCLAICAYEALLVCSTIDEFADMYVTGTPGELLTGQSAAFYNRMSLFFNTATIAVYLVVGFAIAKASASSGNVDQSSRRIFRSLLAIISVNVGGYFLMTAYQLFLVPLIGSPVAVWFCTQAMSLPLNVSAASSGPILYLTSEEYRRAFLSQFGPVLKFFGAKVPPKVQTMQVTALTRSQAARRMTEGSALDQRPRVSSSARLPG